MPVRSYRRAERVNRPTEDAALAQIRKEAKTLSAGMYLTFTDFQWLLYDTERQLRQEWQVGTITAFTLARYLCSTYPDTTAQDIEANRLEMDAIMQERSRHKLPPLPPRPRPLLDNPKSDL